MIIDTHAYLGHWPFRFLPFAEPPRFLSKCAALKVTQSWVGSFDALLHEDMAGVNERLVTMCSQFGKGALIPVGSINPRLPDWEEDLRRCHEVHQMHAIRLHPNYHGYTLDDPLFAQVIDNATKRRLLIQIVVLMEDARTQHPLMRVSPVDLAPLPTLLAERKEARLQILNGVALPRDEVLKPLIRHVNTHFDFATVESVGGVAKLAEIVGIERVLFGSHFPLFHLESAVLKVRESAFKDADRLRLQTQNADRLYRESRP